MPQIIDRGLRLVALATLLTVPPTSGREAEPARTTAVEVLATPGGGIQPQAVIDDAGVIHVVSFTGPPGGGELNYSRIEPGRSDATGAIRVNGRPHSAVAMGSIRGAQIATGRRGRVHVAWNGAAKALPANPIQGSPMLYARLEPGRNEFEPERNLMQRTYGLDGGGSVADDGAGNVYVAWHGRTDEDPASESGRRVWVARSRDDGTTFAPEEPASDRVDGACGCCGMKAIAHPAGHVDLLFRAARGGSERGMVLVSSRDGGNSFASTLLHPWPLRACPMSSAAFAAGPSGIVAAWETNGQVFFARIDDEGGKVSPPTTPPGDARNRKHPALAVNGRGETLLAWAEGTAWQRGGDLAWQVFDPSGRPAGPSGRVARGIPTWSLPTAVTRPDGTFVIIH